MLFNSYIFILGFLPVTLGLFHFLTERGYFRASIFILAAASLIFYAWWSPKYVLLFIALILFNYTVARGIQYQRVGRPELAKLFLILGISINLGTLCYYKYTNFFIDNLNNIFGLHFYFKEIILPIGISFFTFQKIAFLVDVYKNKTSHFNFLDFSLFVLFFPQLIAGPIVHHSEIMPQFSRQNKVTLDSIKTGMTIFIIGLAKKVILADTAATFCTPQFNAVAAGAHPDLLAAWSAVLAYSAQLYFDFSAYSDMAIGIGQFFGIHLPVNFNSPYKSASIIEFWRRWHMTLSRFLRDYLYIPLGGNRKGKVRRYINLFITMLLGGIWHGAGWTFFIWGGLHGVYLIINHGWRSLLERLGIRIPKKQWIIKSGQILTFLSVVVSWVFFRSANFQASMDMFKGMLGNYGFALPNSLHKFYPQLPLSSSNVDSGITLLVALGMLLITWLAPNTQELMSYHGTDKNDKEEIDISQPYFKWQPSPVWAVFIGCLFALCFMMFLHVSEFIYFQF